MKAYAFCHGCLFKVELGKAVIIGRNIYHKNCYKRDVLRVGTGTLQLCYSEIKK
jgi:hypothetical protein